MAKLTLEDVTNISGAESTAISTINSNSNAIETALENTLSRDGTSPNQMNADLDMNSNDILNTRNVYTTNLYVDGIRTTVNTFDSAVLEEIAGIAPVDGNIIVGNGTGFSAQKLTLKVNTVQDLASYTPTGSLVANMPLIAEVRGVDGGLEYLGGGRFVWDGASTATPDTYRVIQPTFNAGNPGRWKRVGNPTVWNANDWGIHPANSDNLALMNSLMGVIPSVAEYPDLIGPWAFLGADVVAFPKGRYAFSDTVEVAPTKNILFAAPNGIGSAAWRHTAPEVAGTDTWLLDYQPGGNCRSIGVRGLHFERGGIRLIGNQNWPITMRDFGIFGCSGTALELVDGDTIGYSGPIQGVGINVVHCDINYMQLAHNYRGARIRASTYLLFRMDKFTIRSTYHTPLEVDCYGARFSDGHLMGVTDAANKPFLHIPGAVNANSHLYFDNINFGSESFGFADENNPSWTTGYSYEPAQRAVVIGDLTTPANNPQGNANIQFTRNTFTGANQPGSETKVAIDVMSPVGNLVIERNYFSRITNHIVKESAVAAGLGCSTGVYGGNIVDNLSLTAVPAGKEGVFSEGGNGFKTDGREYGEGGAIQQSVQAVSALLPNSNVFSSTAWTKINCTVAQNATDRFGVANSAWTVTKTASGAAYLYTALPAAVSGPASLEIWVKRGTGKLIQTRCFNQANSTQRFTAQADTLSLPEDWRKVSIPVRKVPGVIPRWALDLSGLAAGETILVDDAGVYNRLDSSAPVRLVGTRTEDIGPIGAGGSTTRTITTGLSGVALGDLVTVTPSVYLNGLVLTAVVEAANVVRMTLHNPTAATIDPPNCTYTAYVTPSASL